VQPLPACLPLVVVVVVQRTTWSGVEGADSTPTKEYCTDGEQ